MIPVISATLRGAHGGDSPLVVDPDLELSRIYGMKRMLLVFLLFSRECITGICFYHVFWSSEFDRLQCVLKLKTQYIFN